MPILTWPMSRFVLRHGQILRTLLRSFLACVSFLLSGTRPCPILACSRSCRYVFMWVWIPEETHQLVLVASCRIDDEMI